jgi:hypothetical protein
LLEQTPAPVFAYLQYRKQVQIRRVPHLSAPDFFRYRYRLFIFLLGLINKFDYLWYLCRPAYNIDRPFIEQLPTEPLRHTANYADYQIRPNLFYML